MTSHQPTPAPASADVPAAENAGGAVLRRRVETYILSFAAFIVFWVGFIEPGAFSAPSSSASTAATPNTSSAAKTLSVSIAIGVAAPALVLLLNTAISGTPTACSQRSSSPARYLIPLDHGSAGILCRWP
ncbi:hypothetical protein B0H16DRAFT_1732984 [Mycena metata]|uniref:Uncharacterized protein n=1 Tax=Mycena metata TaxID=1033252 RepID=A0AAD7I1D8_9AGAR|nr:hypothetical protein B0H16DRAFT_1732984 [Mycena metata]